MNIKVDSRKGEGEREKKKRRRYLVFYILAFASSRNEENQPRLFAFDSNAEDTCANSRVRTVRNHDDEKVLFYCIGVGSFVLRFRCLIILFRP